MKMLPRRSALSWGLIVVLGLLGTWIALPNYFLHFAKPVLLVPARLPINLNPVLNPEFHYGLAWEGGSRIIFEASFSGMVASQHKSALTAAAASMQQRAQLVGANEPQVTSTLWNNQGLITVDLPNFPWNPQTVTFLTRPTKLDFRVPTAETSQIGSDSAQLFWQSFQPTELDSSRIVQAAVQTIPATKQLGVVVQFDAKGTQLLTDLTTYFKGQRVAIFLDGMPVSAPTINQPITNGVAQIGGNFTPEQMNSLVSELNAAAAPINPQVIAQTSLPPLFTPAEQNRLWTVLVVTGGTSALFLTLTRGRRGFILAAILALQVVWLIALLKICALPIGLASLYGAGLSLITTIGLLWSQRSARSALMVLPLVIGLGTLIIVNPLLVGWLSLDTQLRTWAASWLLGTLISWCIMRITKYELV
jgi:preprotein translocase subunit SecD